MRDRTRSGSAVTGMRRVPAAEAEATAQVDVENGTGRAPGPVPPLRERAASVVASRGPLAELSCSMDSAKQLQAEVERGELPPSAAADRLLGEFLPKEGP